MHNPLAMTIQPTAPRIFSPTVKGIFWMIATLLSFVGMAVAARELSFRMSTFEIQFFRALIALLLVLPFAIRGFQEIRHTSRLELHFFRNFVHFGATQLWIIGITLLPLSQVFALEFTTPIWGTLLAALFLSEKLTPPRLVAVIGGFIGILIILRPGFGVFNPASILVLGAAFGYAVSIITTKFLSRTTSAVGITFWMSLMQTCFAAIPAYLAWVTPTLIDLPWLFTIGFTGLSAHYCMVRALKLADATIIMPIDFARLPLVAIVGYFLYAELLDLWVFAGAAVIFAVNYYSVRKEHN